MAIEQGMCSSFKQQILLGEHDLDTDVIKIALYTNAADLSAATTVYTSTGEVAASGYVAGGKVLTGATVSLDGTVAVVGFSDISWTSALTARGALIYNSSKSNKAIAVLDFGSDKTSTSVFTVNFPVASAGSAVVQVA